jgi:prevent-host-death family protein
MDRIGIRELRLNLSAAIRRVRQGETIEITDRGRPVGRLTPVPETEGMVDRLVAEGRLISARRPRSPLPEPVAPIAPGSVEEVMSELRRDADG